MKGQDLKFLSTVFLPLQQVGGVAPQENKLSRRFKNPSFVTTHTKLLVSVFMLLFISAAFIFSLDKVRIKIAEYYIDRGEYLSAYQWYCKVKRKAFSDNTSGRFKDNTGEVDKKLADTLLRWMESSLNREAGQINKGNCRKKQAEKLEQIIEYWKQFEVSWLADAKDSAYTDRAKKIIVKTKLYKAKLYIQSQFYYKAFSIYEELNKVFDEKKHPPKNWESFVKAVKKEFLYDYYHRILRGIRLKNRGKFDEAMNVLISARNLFSGDVEVYFHIADLYRLMKRRDLASQEFYKAVKLAKNTDEKAFFTSLALLCEEKRDRAAKSTKDSTESYGTSKKSQSETQSPAVAAHRGMNDPNSKSYGVPKYARSKLRGMKPALVLKTLFDKKFRLSETSLYLALCYPEISMQEYISYLYLALQFSPDNQQVRKEILYAFSESKDLVKKPWIKKGRNLIENSSFEIGWDFKKSISSWGIYFHDNAKNCTMELKQIPSFEGKRSFYFKGGTGQYHGGLSQFLSTKTNTLYLAIAQIKLISSRGFRFGFYWANRHFTFPEGKVKKPQWKQIQQVIFSPPEIKNKQFFLQFYNQGEAYLDNIKLQELNIIYQGKNIKDMAS